MDTLPRTQRDVALSLLAGGASTGKPADQRFTRSNDPDLTQRAKRAASAREGAHSHGRAANVRFFYFVTDSRASCRTPTSPVNRAS